MLWKIINIYFRKAVSFDFNFLIHRHPVWVKTERTWRGWHTSADFELKNKKLQNSQTSLAFWPLWGHTGRGKKAFLRITGSSSHFDKTWCKKIKKCSMELLPSTNPTCAKWLVLPALGSIQLTWEDLSVTLSLSALHGLKTAKYIYIF